MPWLNFSSKNVKKTSKSRKIGSQGRPGAPHGRPRGTQATPRSPKVTPRSPKVSQRLPKGFPKGFPKARQKAPQDQNKFDAFSKLGFVHRRSVFEPPKPKVDYPYYVLGTLEILILVKSDETIVNTIRLEPSKKPVLAWEREARFNKETLPRISPNTPRVSPRIP